MRAYEIRLTTPGFDAAVGKVAAMGRPLVRIEQLFGKLAAAGAGLDATAGRLNKIADALERINKGQAAITGSPAPAAVGGGGSRTKSTGPKMTTGPYTRRAELEQEKAAAIAAGNPLAKSNADRAIFLAERAIHLDQQRRNDPNAMTGKGLLELFRDMNGLLGALKRGAGLAASSRIISLGGGRNTGGGLNIQQMQAFGISSLGGTSQGNAASGIMARLGPLAGRAIAIASSPVTIAAGLAAGSIVALGAAAKIAAGIFRGIGSAGALSGASSSEIAALRALGISPGDVPGLGAGLRERMSSDPFAIASAGHALPGHLTGQSNAPLVQRQMERLHQLYAEGRAQDAVLLARRLGIEVLLDEAMVSGRVWKDRQKDLEAAKRIYTPQQTQAARDFAAQQTRIAQQWEDMKAAFGGPHLQRFGDAMGMVANLMRWVTQAAPVFNFISDLMNPLGFIGRILDIQRLLTGGGGQNGKSQMAQNTDALNALAMALKEVVGGGPRARGALSPGQKAAIQNGLNWDAARNLGAFRL